VARIAPLGDGGFERLNRGESAAEHLPGGADSLDAICGAHVLLREIGVEDFGDFVPGGFVGAGDVVELVAFDEKVVEDGVEVGGHGKTPKGLRGGGEKSQISKWQIANWEDGSRKLSAGRMAGAKKWGSLQRDPEAPMARNNRN